MWWCVKPIKPGEVHVYPFKEEHEHILDGALCNCLPEMKETIGGSLRVVVHKKIADASKIHIHGVRPFPP